jgi:hypothetical protein
VARAEKHLKTASRLVRWFARNECTVERKPNIQTRQIDAIARLGTPSPVISLILGDAIHNLRSALDHLVFQLVVSNPDPDKPSDVPNDKTMFPICDTKHGFRRQVDKLGRITGVSDDVAAIIQRFQPYHRRDAGLDHRVHALWLLNTLENIDKHRRMTIVAGVAIGHRASIQRADGTVTEHIARIGETVLPDGATLWSFTPPGPGEGDMEVKGTLFSTVAFNEPDAGLTNVEAVGLLWQIFDVVNERLVPELGAYVW